MDTALIEQSGLQNAKWDKRLGMEYLLKEMLKTWTIRWVGMTWTPETGPG